jgi:hypothetical protein
MSEAPDNASRFRGDQLRSNHEAAPTPFRAFFSRRALRPVFSASGEDARHGPSSAPTGPFQNYRSVNFFAVAEAEFRRAVNMLNFGLAASG